MILMRIPQPSDGAAVGSFFTFSFKSNGCEPFAQTLSGFVISLPGLTVGAEAGGLRRISWNNWSSMAIIVRPDGSVN